MTLKQLINIKIMEYYLAVLKGEDEEQVRLRILEEIIYKYKKENIGE